MGSWLKLGVVTSLLALVTSTQPVSDLSPLRRAARTVQERATTGATPQPFAPGDGLSSPSHRSTANAANVQRRFLAREDGSSTLQAEMPPAFSRTGRGGRVAEASVHPSTVLMHYVDGTSSAQRRDAADDAGGRVVGSIPELSVDVVSTDGSSRSQVTQRLEDDPRVERVEPNAIATYLDIPNDTLFGLQTHLFASRLPAAWDVAQGHNAVDPAVIAIVDSGVKLDHPDLQANLVAGRDIAATPDDNVPDDVIGHGTLVAGVAGADTDNAVGVAGAGWDAKIMPVKVGDAAPTVGDIAAGIVWATDNGADVVNLSLGFETNEPALSSAVDYAITNGATVVAAAGNESSSDPLYPAAYPAVIAVGATDSYGDVVGFSNRGPWVDVVAQGSGVVGTCLNCEGGYGFGDGTSFSSPVVAGVVGLMLAKNPALTPAQVQDKLRTTAIDRGPRGIDDHYGWGLVDAYAAVGGKTAAAPPPAVRGSGEPDDTAARARAIGTGATGAISPEGDADWFSYDAPQAGTLTVTVTPPEEDSGFGVSFNPVITAVSPALDEIGTFNVSGPAAAEAANVSVTAAGRYLLRIENVNSSRSSGPASAPHEYAIQASFAAGSPAAPPASRLWVTDVDPAPFAQDVSATVSPVVSFARNLTEASGESSANVRLVDATTNLDVPASLTYTDASKTVQIDPVATLPAGRPYVIRVNGVVDTDSNVLSETYSSRFVVAAAAQPLDLDADFNKDGYEDAVMTAPGEDLGAKKDAGVVHVLYGSSNGPKGSGSQMWSQDSPGVPGGPESGDRFGEAFATGDVNNDGYDDLLIGAPREDTKHKDAGAVQVLFGSSTGLRANNKQLWTQDASGLPGASEPGDLFGYAIAVGAFDGSAGDDVAIGSPGEGIGEQGSAGAVHVLRGGAGGLTASGAKLWTQDSNDIGLVASAGDKFGFALGAGDLHGDTHDDLAIGAPSDDIVIVDEFDQPQLKEGAGTVMVMHGSIVGLRPAFPMAEFFDGGLPQTNGAFGASVSVADVGGYGPTDGYGDVIVGAYGRTLSSKTRAGRVNVQFNDHTELLLTNQTLDQSSFGLGGIETDARFGNALAARTFGSRGVLAVGVSLDDRGSAANAGAVHLFDSDLVTTDGFYRIGPSRSLTQDSPGVPGALEAGDRFGYSVGLIDTDADGKGDLIAGSPFESIGSATAAGGAHAVRNAIGSATPTSLLFTQDTRGVAGAVESKDWFGFRTG